MELGRRRDYEWEEGELENGIYLVFSDSYQWELWRYEFGVFFYYGMTINKRVGNCPTEIYGPIERE